MTDPRALAEQGVWSERLAAARDFESPPSFGDLRDWAIEAFGLLQYLEALLASPTFCSYHRGGAGYPVTRDFTREELVEVAMDTATGKQNRAQNRAH